MVAPSETGRYIPPHENLIPIDNQVIPIASFLLKHINEIEPVKNTSTGLWPKILQQGAEHEWSSYMTAESRYIFRDQTEEVPKCICLFSDPEEIRSYINGICADEFTKISPHLRPHVSNLLNGKDTLDIVPAFFALNQLANRVNFILNSRMTDAAWAFRNENYRIVLNAMGIRLELHDRIIHPELHRNEPPVEIPIEYSFVTPIKDQKTGLITGVKQHLQLIPMPPAGVDLIRNLTPKAFSMETPDPSQDQDPEQNPDFLARRLLMIGNWWNRGANEVLREVEVNKTMTQLMKLFHTHREEPSEPTFTD